MLESLKNPSQTLDKTYHVEFNYTNDNPYTNRLNEEFSEIALCDLESEKHKNRWNKEVFKNQNPLYFEIGSGFGHFMIQFLNSTKNINFIGCDYRFKRSYNSVLKIKNSIIKENESNFKFLRAKGERVHYIFGENELDGIFYFFPDPWPKRRHHKKRLIQEHFVKEAIKVLKPGAHFYIKTDHDEYFSQMLEVFSKFKEFEVILQTSDLHAQEEKHPILNEMKTKFEKIFIGKNKNINALILKLNK